MAYVRFFFICQDKTRQRYSVPLGEVVILRSLGASIKRKYQYKLASIQDRHIAYKIKAVR
jgi:hypothetical protein